MRRKLKYTDDFIREVVASSTSFIECFRKMNDPISGSAYRHLRQRIDELNLDTSHMLGSGHLLGGEPINKVPTVELFKLPKVKSSILRYRLVLDGYKKNECEWCGISTWRELPAPLELDHIDGNHSNNVLENLRILCANCHAQTPTYRGRKLKKSYVQPSVDVVQ